MKKSTSKILFTVFCFLVSNTFAIAGSSYSGSRSYSSPSRSYSSPSRSYSAPSRSYSSPAPTRSYSSPPRPSTSQPSPTRTMTPSTRRPTTSYTSNSTSPSYNNTTSSSPAKRYVSPSRSSVGAVAVQSQQYKNFTPYRNPNTQQVTHIYHTNSGHTISSTLPWIMLGAYALSNNTNNDSSYRTCQTQDGQMIPDCVPGPVNQGGCN